MSQTSRTASWRDTSRTAKTKKRDSSDENEGTEQLQRNAADELLQVQRLEAQLKECSSDTLLDLEPLENTDVAFVIELIDPQQKPIATKNGEETSKKPR